jgi:hypothetical protein
MLATLKEYGAFLKPKVVLWFYYEGNDMRDLNGREKFSPLLRQYLGSPFSQNLIFRQQEVDKVLTAYLEQAMESQATSFKVEEFLKLQHLRASFKSAVNKRKGREGFQLELIDHLEKDGAPSSKEDLELVRTVLEEASRTVFSWQGQMASPGIRTGHPRSIKRLVASRITSEL